MSGIREPSDYTLGSWEKCFKQQIHSAMSPISPGTLLEWIDEIRRLRAENDDLRHLVHRAIPGQFDACSNSYVNSWLEKWLRLAQALGVYRGPLVGNCNELRANWLEARDGGS